MWREGIHLAAIADDLTGSCDTAVQFSRYGLKSLVSHLPSVAAESAAPIFVLNTESRKQRTAAAMQTVSVAARVMMASGRPVFYQKIDSTLKGNWVAEVVGLFKSIHPSLVFVAPAFPEWGRTTVDGVQLLHGNPVSESRLARKKTALNPKESLKSDLVASLQEQLGKRVSLINGSISHKGPQRIEQAIERARSRGARFIVFDATSDGDLRNVCLGGCRLEDEILWVGSAGLARFLPLGWGFQLVARPALAAPSRKAAVVINGSLHPANGPQLEFLAKNRSIHRLTLVDDDQAALPETQLKLDRAMDALGRGVDVAMSLCPNRGIQSLAQLQRLHIVLQWCSSELIQRDLVGGTVIVGGETAAKIYRDLGAKGIFIEGEVHPGVPIGFWSGGILDRQPVITKAGGFGHQDTLLRAVEYLRSGKMDA